MSIIAFETPDEADKAIRADQLCKRIGRVLQQHYRNRNWFVEVSIAGGIAKILCPSISMRHGYVIHIDRPELEIDRQAVMAGGQILEMFNLSRERDASGGEDKLLRDARGEVLQAETGL